jgi:hypothetical protein
MWNNFSRIKDMPVWHEYQKFLMSSLRVIFERFELQWTFNHYTFSGQWPSDIIPLIVQQGDLAPWIQKNSSHHKLWAWSQEHWLQYLNTLDPIFSLHPHPLLALIRSVFFSNHADI